MVTDSLVLVSSSKMLFVVEILHEHHHGEVIKCGEGQGNWSAWNLQSWGNVMFSDEARFCLRKTDGRVRVWRRRGERYSDCCIERVTPFNGGSVRYGLASP